MDPRVFRIFALLLPLLLVAARSSAECYEFAEDPDLQLYVNEGNSDQYYSALTGSTEIPDGGRISIGFIIRDYAFSSFGHSTVWGPQDHDLEALPFVRINLHFDQRPFPQFSIYSRDFHQFGERFPLAVGVWYRVDVVHHGDTATAELYDAQGSLLFTDTLDVLWGPFDTFMVCYDYYGGGYCRWDEAGAEIDFRSDRGANFLEGSIDFVCLSDVPTAVAKTTWGRIKAGHR